MLRSSCRGSPGYGLVELVVCNQTIKYAALFFSVVFSVVGVAGGVVGYLLGPVWLKIAILVFGVLTGISLLFTGRDMEGASFWDLVFIGACGGFLASVLT